VTRRDIPNLISILRILLVVPIIFLMREREFGIALLLFFVAGISDGIDGYLAKRNHWASRLGSILDPLADKILLVSSFIMLSLLSYLPMWLVVVVLLRDLTIVVGATIYHFVFGKYEMVPTLISKLNTFMQILLVLGLVFSLGLYPLPEKLIDVLIYSVLATTLASGIDYVVVWGRKAYRLKSKGE